MDYAQARENMIDGQLRPNQVNTPVVLQRFAAVPREKFVPAEAQGLAYQDRRLKLSDERELLPPRVTARLIQALDLHIDDKLLVLAAGPGYSAAICAPLVSQLVVVEDQLNLLEQAKTNLPPEAKTHTTFLASNPAAGSAKQGPFHKILIDCAVAEIPAAILDQLKTGGRLAAVIAGEDGVCEATVLNKSGRTVVREALFETAGKFHPAFAPEDRFVF